MALIFAFLFGGGVVLLLESTPKQQAIKNVKRCIEIAQIMGSYDNFRYFLNSKSDKTPWGTAMTQSDPAIYGHTMACLYGRQP